MISDHIHALVARLEVAAEFGSSVEITPEAARYLAWALRLLAAMVDGNDVEADKIVSLVNETVPSPPDPAG